MKNEALSYFPHTHLTTLAMLIFLTVFLGVLVWSVMKTQKGHFDKMAHMPLDEENNNGN